MTSHTGEITNPRYRSAVADIIRRIQKTQRMNDVQVAERLDCSAGTIRNVRNELTSLDPVILVRIESAFGPGAIDSVLSLSGVRAVPLSESRSAHDPVLAVVEALHRIIEVQAVDSDAGTRITDAEIRRIIVELRQGRAALDSLIARGDAS